MKHLLKFNENKDELMDVEYLTNCFVDLIDKGATIDYGEEEKHRITWEEFVVKIKIPMLKNYSSSFKVEKSKISEHIESAKRELEILEEIEYSLEKVAIKYEINHEIVTDRKTYYADNLFEISVIFRKYLYGE
jgi:hypothetical protein